MSRVPPVLALLVATGALDWAHRATAQDATPPAEDCAVYRSEEGGVLTFEGEGDVVTEPFPVEVGGLIVSVEYEGGDDTASFQARLVDLEQGGSAPGPFLAGSGTVQDAIPIVYASDRVVLDVNANGKWTIAIEQG